MRTKQGGNLGTASSRRNLKQRREPYWVVIVRGCALGYRKGKNGGTWIARYRGDNGKQQYEALGAADDLNDNSGMGYEAALREARKHFKAGPSNTGKVTVGDTLDTYLAHIQANNPESTINDTKARIDSILKPHFGTTRLSRLTSKDITRWRDRAAKDRKPDTVNRLMTILKAALNYAWKEEKQVADDSQWRMVTRLKGGGARKIFLTPAQARTLLDHCEPQAFKNLVQVALLTGARYGELTALQVQDFDSATATLEIQGGKTGSRTVYLQTEALPFFRKLAKDKPADALLIPRENGERWGKNHHQKPFDKALKAAKLDPDTTFYALRHSYISLALLSRVNIKVLANNTGTSVRMIEMHYAKFLDKDRRAMFNKMKGLISAEVEPVEA